MATTYATEQCPWLVLGIGPSVKSVCYIMHKTEIINFSAFPIPRALILGKIIGEMHAHMLHPNIV